MNRWRWSATGIALLIAIVVGVGLVAGSPPQPSANASPIPASERRSAPEFVGIDGWLNSQPLTLQSLHGHVVLIDFWTFSCINCVRTIPHLQTLSAAYQPKGLVIVGVHSPEFDFEKVPNNVESAVARLGVTWPVAIDSEMATWNAYNNQYWPAEYLLDQNGHIAAVNFGEGDYDGTGAMVANLLGISPISLASGPPVPQSGITGELYAGSIRGQLGGAESYGGIGVPTTYPSTAGFERDQITLAGSWTDSGEYLVADQSAHLHLKFVAGKVFVVAGNSGTPGSISVLLDGNPVSSAIVDRQDLFPLIEGLSSGEHTLDLALSPGTSIYTLTFG